MKRERCLSNTKLTLHGFSLLVMITNGVTIHSHIQTVDKFMGIDFILQKCLCSVLCCALVRPVQFRPTNQSAALVADVSTRKPCSQKRLRKS